MMLATHRAHPTEQQLVRNIVQLAAGESPEAKAEVLRTISQELVLALVRLKAEPVLRAHAEKDRCRTPNALMAVRMYGETCDCDVERLDQVLSGGRGDFIRRRSIEDPGLSRGELGWVYDRLRAITDHVKGVVQIPRKSFVFTG